MLAIFRLEDQKVYECADGRKEDLRTFGLESIGEFWNIGNQRQFGIGYLDWDSRFQYIWNICTRGFRTQDIFRFRNQNNHVNILAATTGKKPCYLERNTKNIINIRNENFEIMHILKDILNQLFVFDLEKRDKLLWTNQGKINEPKISNRVTLSHWTKYERVKSVKMITKTLRHHIYRSLDILYSFLCP